MKKAERQQFERINFGEEIAPIGLTGASLITLPLGNESDVLKKQIIASGSPDKKFSPNIEEFWSELILAQDVSLVVNLV